MLFNWSSDGFVRGPSSDGFVRGPSSDGFVRGPSSDGFVRGLNGLLICGSGKKLTAYTKWKPLITIKITARQIIKFVTVNADPNLGIRIAHLLFLILIKFLFCIPLLKIFRILIHNIKGMH